MTRQLIAIATLLIVWRMGLCFAATEAQAERQAPVVIDQRGTQQQPIVVTADPGSVTTEELQRDREHEQERREDSEIQSAEQRERAQVDTWTIRIGVLTALILLGQGAAFVYQARELHRSVIEMKAATKVAQRSARMARTSARAAVRANALNRKALAADHRPWISVGTDPVLRLSRGQGCWSFNWECLALNSGKSPAQNVTVAAVLLRQPGANPEAEHQRLRDEVTSVRSPVESVIFPDEPRSLEASVVLPDEWLQSSAPTSSIEYHVVIVGCVSYRFAQEDSVHVTGFRYGLSRPGSILKLPWPPPVGWNVEHLATYRHHRGWFAT